MPSRRPSALSPSKGKNRNTPSRERTRPDMTCSGRSIVLATVSTTNFAPVSVGQMKKLYTTSCLAVINWSNSSIKATLHPDLSKTGTFPMTDPLTKRDQQARYVDVNQVTRQIFQCYLGADAQVSIGCRIVSRDCLPE